MFLIAAGRLDNNMGGTNSWTTLKQKRERITKKKKRQ